MDDLYNNKMYLQLKKSFIIMLKKCNNIKILYLIKYEMVYTIYKLEIFVFITVDFILNKKYIYHY